MILVIGGAGYIGSHVLKALRQAGIEHLAFDNLSKGHQAALAGSPLYQGDIRSPEDLDGVFKSNTIDAVMHFAAYIEVGESVSNPGKYYENNLMGVLNLVQKMNKHGIAKLVFSSTAAVYGEPQYGPIDEDHPTAPTSPYGETKLAVERLLHWFEIAHGLRSVRLRYFNAPGSDADGVLGEDHDPETHLIPRAILAQLGMVDALKLFGTDYDTPDGTCIRDYVHVEDLAQAHILALRHLMAGGESRVYNLGNGQGFSVREVIDTIEQVSGKPVPCVEAPRRAGDPARLVASSDRIRGDLGWTPQYHDLTTIVRHAYDWRLKNPTGYQK